MYLSVPQSEGFVGGWGVGWMLRYNERNFFEGKESLPKEGCQATKWMKKARGQRKMSQNIFKDI